MPEQFHLAKKALGPHERAVNHFYSRNFLVRAYAVMFEGKYLEEAQRRHDQMSSGHDNSEAGKIEAGLQRYSPTPRTLDGEKRNLWLGARAQDGTLDSPRATAPEHNAYWTE